MIYEKVYINKTAYADAYILNRKISYQTSRRRPLIIICPGGAYLFKATKEGECVAMEFLSRGYHTVVLQYTSYFRKRVDLAAEKPELNPESHFPLQMLELMETIQRIHQKSEDWYVDTKNIFVIGFSAGAHIAASLGVHWNEECYKTQLSMKPIAKELKPRGLVLAYPLLNGSPAGYMAGLAEESRDIKAQLPYMNAAVTGKENPTEADLEPLDIIRNINDDVPPVFIWHTYQDQITDPRNSILLAAKLLKENIPCEFHLFPEGHHGMGLCNEVAAKSEGDVNKKCQKWVEFADEWMKGLVKNDK